MQKRYIPNILSIIRMCLVPLFVYLFFLDYPNYVWHAVFVFFLAGATDVVDGYLARKYQWGSNLGKILDPLADKLMQCVVLSCLYIKDIIPLWLLVVYIGKELLILIGSLFVLRKTNIVVKSNFMGKLAVCVFYAGIVLLVLLDFFVNAEYERLFRFIICVVMVSFAFGALTQYFKKYINSKMMK